MNDVNRLRILQDVIDRRLTTRLAATRLDISDRHCRRLLERYREHGPLSLVNRRGQPGNRQLMPGLAERALRIIRERYADFGPTLASEKLAEVHGLYLAKETVRKLMTQAGLWIPRKLRPLRVHQPRPRRACTGELIQIDGFEHRWFEDRAPACTLLVYVDDVTFTWREQRKVSKNLTLQYDKKLYLLEDNEENRRFQGKYIDVWQYPDGTIELRANGTSLPFITYDRLGELDQGGIIDNKRLGRALEMIKLVQDKRDNTRSQALPSLDGQTSRRKKQPGKKSQRSLNKDDMLEALQQLQARSEDIFGKS